MRIKISSGGIVRCDKPNCAERFITYSFLRLARTQARAVGWLRVGGGSVLDAEGNKVAKKADLCPAHGREHNEAKAARKAAKAPKKTKAAA